MLLSARLSQCRRYSSPMYSVSLASISDRVSSSVRLVISSTAFVRFTHINNFLIETLATSRKTNPTILITDIQLEYFIERFRLGLKLSHKLLHSLHFFSNLTLVFRLMSIHRPTIVCVYNINNVFITHHSHSSSLMSYLCATLLCKVISRLTASSSP